MAGATVLVDPADLELDPEAEERASADRNVTRNLAVLRGWTDHRPEAGRVRLPAARSSAGRCGCSARTG